MKTTSVLVAVGVLVVSALMGCGGDVDVTTGPGGGGGEGGAGGQGGAGAAGGGVTTTTTTTTTATTTVTTTTTSTGTTNPAAYCDNLCAQGSQYGCVEMGQEQSCIEGCNKVFADYEDCAGETVAFYDCIVAQLPITGCESGEACQPETEAFASCINGGTTTCGVTGCEEGPGECSCTGECDNQMFQVDCKSSPNGIQCGCFINGELVEVCAEVELTCDIFGGCCAASFGLGG